MNDDAALKFEVPAKCCGLKSRFHFTPKLTLLNLNLLKERSYRTMLEIFNHLAITPGTMTPLLCHKYEENRLTDYESRHLRKRD